MYSQADEEGQQYTLMSEIINHKSDGKVLSKDDGFYLDCYGKQQPRITTCGWKLLVEWKDRNSSWVTLNDMNDSYPVDTAEYSVMNKISTEPAFAWWVPHVLWKRSWIKNHMTLYLLITHRHLVVIMELKGWHHILHFFLNCHPPETCSCFLVNS